MSSIRSIGSMSSVKKQVIHSETDDDISDYGEYYRSGAYNKSYDDFSDDEYKHGKHDKHDKGEKDLRITSNK